MVLYLGMAKELKVQGYIYLVPVHMRKIRGRHARAHKADQRHSPKDP